MFKPGKYLVVYRECNITGWHMKAFFFKRNADKFIERLKKHYEFINLYYFNYDYGMRCTIIL